MVPPIRARRLRKVYGGKVALDSVDLDVAQGETLGVVGLNGAGKTTLMSCLLGLLRPDAGEIAISNLPPHDLRLKRKLGYMPERPAYEPWMTGSRFLSYQHAMAALSGSHRARDIRILLERVHIESDAAERPVRTYSKGMLQRLGLAQALLGDPQFLFLDEPTSGVDPTGLLIFRELVNELHASGVTIVLNSHNLHEVERSCDRVAFVNAGRVETVETVSGATLARTLRVSWLPQRMPPNLGQDALLKLAEGAGATLNGAAVDHARFDIPDDNAASRLLSALFAAGVPLVEAVPERNRLERLVVARIERDAP